MEIFEKLLITTPDRRHISNAIHYTSILFSGNILNLIILNDNICTKI